MNRLSIELSERLKDMEEYFINYVGWLVRRGYNEELVRKKLLLDYTPQEVNVILAIVKKAGITIPASNFLDEDIGYNRYEWERRVKKKRS